MSKIFYVLILSFVFVSNVFAQSKDKTPEEAPPGIIPRAPAMHNTVIPCDTKQYVMNLAENTNGEKLLFDADGILFALTPGTNVPEPRGGQVSFYVNMETGSWSLVIHPSEHISCLVMNGSKFVAGGKK